MFLSNSNNYKSNKKLINLSLTKKKITYDKKSRYFNGGIYFLNKSILKKFEIFFFWRWFIKIWNSKKYYFRWIL